MLTGGLGYSYNARTSLPLTQTNLAAYPTTPSTVATPPLTHGMPNAYGGLIVIAPNVHKVGTGYTGRRVIVEDKRCNACHQELGTFTEDAFHAGQRNDGTTCSWCHTPNRASSGWTAETDNMTHAIHGAAKRTDPLHVAFGRDAGRHASRTSCIRASWRVASSATCRGTYDFGNSASANAVGLGTDQVDKRQYRLVASGTPAASISNSPYILPFLGVPLGANFSFNAATGVTTPADPTTLVTVADGGRLRGLPRQRTRAEPYDGERRLVLRGAQHGNGEGRAVLRLPRQRPNRGHHAGAREVI